MAVTLFEVAGKLVLDKGDFEKDVANAEESGSNLGSKLSKGIGLGAKALGAGIAAAAAGVVKITKSAFDGYKEYEQLVGGVETLFGTGGKTLEEYANSVGLSVDEAKGKFDSLSQAESLVMTNAQNAWQTAGLSVNEYMEQATSTAAALVSSVGGDTVKAAQIADQAIIDMADNANKMGTSIESIQNAYSGFAKGNFTMLDNLKLGYGGTRSEMQKLLKDAEKYQRAQGKNVKYSIDNYADIVEAIHVVQTEMGITGTTAEEASETIAGSMAAAKASWQNFQIALGSGNNDQIRTAMNNLVNSVKTALGNIIPELTTILSSLAGAIKDLAPVLAAELPGLVDALLPPLLDAAVSLVAGLIAALPGIIQAIVDALPKLLEAVGNAIIDLFSSVFDIDLRDVWNKVTTQIVEVWNSLKTKAKTIWEGIKTTVTNVWNTISTTAVTVWETIKETVTTAIENAKTTLGQTWETIRTTAVGLWNRIKAAAKTAWDAIKSAIKDPIEAVKGALSTAWETIKSVAQTAWQAISDVVSPIINGIKTVIDGVSGAVSTFIGWLKDLFGYDGKSTNITANFGAKVSEWIEKIRKWAEEGVKIKLKFLEQIFSGNSGNSEDDPDWKENPEGGWNPPNLNEIYGDAKGQNYVPYDDYLTRLHRGEAVLNRSQADKWRNGEDDTTSLSGVADAVSRAILQAMENMSIVMDGKEVGNIVAQQVSRNIGRAYAYGGGW